MPVNIIILANTWRFFSDDIRPHAVMNSFNNKINGSKPTIKNPVKLNCLPRAFQDNYAFRFASFLTQEINETKAA